MNVQQNHIGKKSSLCKECALFYGNEAFQGLCSTCHKKCQGAKKEEIMIKSPAQTLTPASVAQKELLDSMEELSLQPVKKQQKDKKRCFDCNKKTGLLGIECKCGYVYCNAHRMPEIHNCGFDYKQTGKDKLKKEVIKVYNGKIAEI